MVKTTGWPDPADGRVQAIGRVASAVERTRLAQTRGLRQALARASLLVALASALSSVALIALSPAQAVALATLALGEVVIWLTIAVLARRVRRRYVLPLTAISAVIVIPARLLTLAILTVPRPVTLTYLELIPLLVALMVPWSERAHRWWLLYVVVSGGLFAVSPLAASLPNDQRMGLALSLLATCGLSLYGQRLLARSRIREAAERRRLRALNARLRDQQLTLDELNRHLTETSRLDPLTGLANRRSFDEDLVTAWRVYARSGCGYAAVLFDLDRFKAINDRGHLIGDAVLRTVAETLREGARPGEVVYRWGGEEFVLLLPEATVEVARLAADRLRRSVMALGIGHPDNEPWGVVTISAGVAVAHGSDATAVEVIRWADVALGRAKSAGRNRVEGQVNVAQ